MIGGRACNQGNFPDIDPLDKVVRMVSRVRTTAVETVNSQPLSQSLLPDLSFECLAKVKATTILTCTGEKCIYIPPKVPFGLELSVHHH